ncbi:MAG TPA: hypothetical protein PKW28_03305 [Turneriella sp.]|nr:hypothetical protein [Turneriella sp.]HNJ64895.1 hypothetical protein [Turneriella sp.]HNL53040.1 hypothetical protein [Turneriella sp.]
MYRALIGLLLLTGVLQPLSARLHLLVDERLRKSSLEQVIYRFVPLTSAPEVELTYVRNFMQGEAAQVYAAKMREADRAIYIGADRYPGDAQIGALMKNRAWYDLLGKIYFLVINDAPDYVPLPRGLFSHDDLWRKFAELSGARHAGFLNRHVLDNRVAALKDWRPGRGSCVHQSGALLVPSARGPIRFHRDGFSLSYRQKGQADMAGDWVCLNTPLADTIFQVRVARTDVLLAVKSARFSAWNDAQPLAVTLQSDRQISAPLALEFVPEVNSAETEFFFQGDRLSCAALRCGKKGARFLLPEMAGLSQQFDLAFRGRADAYFRGTIRLMAGEIELARASVRLLPHSWLTEMAYALSHPSEYRLFFLYGLGGLILVLATLVLLYRFFRSWLGRLQARRAEVLPAQSSAVLEVAPGDSLRLTATDNPFGCELLGFGGIVRVDVLGDGVDISHGQGQGGRFHWADFRYALPDGYVLDFRPAGSRARLFVYRLSEKGLSATSVKPGQTLQSQQPQM